MPNTLRVQWTITPQTAPQPWLNCSRCRGPRPFRSSGKVRVNANGKRIDAWLIYLCTSCDSTWNRPIVERRQVPVLSPQFLMALHANEPALVRRLAFDVEALRRWTGRVQSFDDVVVAKEVLSGSARSVLLLEIDCRLSDQIALRIDRLLASELQMSRSCVRRMGKAAQIATVPQGPSLRRSLRNGMRLIIDVSSIPEGSLDLATGPDHRQRQG